MKKRIILLLVILITGTPIFAQSLYTHWVERYNGPGDTADVVMALTINDLGSAYITGYSYGDGTGKDFATIRYYSTGYRAGDTTWLRRYEDSPYDVARDIAVDGSGNVYVTGNRGSGYNFVTIKYDPTGDSLWAETYSGPYSDDIPCAIALDDSGNVYVTGSSYGIGTERDYATVKYDTDGGQQWVSRYNGSADLADLPAAIAVDNSGNVYITGYSRIDQSDYDYVTIKYDADGDTVWVKSYDGPAGSCDVAYDLAVDDSGYVYVTGWCSSTGTGADIATLKYDSDGDTIWVNRYDGGHWSNDVAYALALDGSGNVYVAGKSYQGSSNREDYCIIKYLSNGSTDWERFYDGDSSDVASDIVVDDSGYVYVTGYSYGTEKDYTTVKYDTDGDLIWDIDYNGPANGDDEAVKIAIDDLYNVYVTGTSQGDGTYADYATLKYSQYCRPGDANEDGIINIGDAVYILNYIFKGGPPPAPYATCSCDANGDCSCNTGDIVYINNYVFSSGPPPVTELEWIDSCGAPVYK